MSEQSMQALSYATEIRVKRSVLRRDIAAGDVLVTDVLTDVPVCAQTMTIGVLLLAQRRWGRKKVDVFLGSIHLDSDRRIGTLTARRRAAICDALRNGVR